MKIRLVLAAALCSVHAEGAPRLDLVMKPHAPGDQNSYLAVSMTLESPKVAAGDTLIHIPLKIVGIPTARYDGNAIAARDDSGPLELIAEDEPPTPQWIYRHWKVTRATVGDVVVTYKAPPRQVTATTNNGPLFDLREEAGGFAGAGVGFLALPVKEGPYPCFTLTHRTSHVFELGFARASLSDGGVIHDLVPNSAAARAGIKDGDQVMAVNGLVEARKQEEKSLALTLRRGSVQTEVTYSPRGAEVAGYGWVRSPKAGEQDCKF
jgi:hypothetical protein